MKKCPGSHFPVSCQGITLCIQLYMAAAQIIADRAHRAPFSITASNHTARSPTPERRTIISRKARQTCHFPSQKKYFYFV